MFAVNKKRCAKVVLWLVLGVIVVIWIDSYSYGEFDEEIDREEFESESLYLHVKITDRFFDKRLEWTTSILGRLLFKHDQFAEPVSQQNRTFLILWWKYRDWLKKRHLHNLRKAEPNPFKDCNVTNCIYSGEDDKLATADAVVIHLQHGNIPKVANRNPKQRWIFLNDETPKNVYSPSSPKMDFKELANVFNWSMTFRSDADVPVPYGRTELIEELEMIDLRTVIPNWNKKRRDVPIAILISNCAIEYRMHFITELQKYIPVDVYGACSNNITRKKRCPGHYKSDCAPMSEYLFYLALENSNCREYLTEKIWYHAYYKGAIPVIMGPSASDCQAFLPPESYLHIPMTVLNDTEQIREWANDILTITRNDRYIFSLHSWRYHFRVRNEHGYFGTKSNHLCRVCEALNYNDNAEKIYDEKDLKWFLDPELLCESQP